MFRGSRLLSRRRYGPGTGLAHELRLTFLGSTYKLLTVLVKNIGVAFNGIQSRALVNLDQEAVKRGEYASGLDEFIEISRDNDVCVLIQSEDRIDELLEQDELLTKIEHKQMHTPR